MIDAREQRGLEIAAKCRIKQKGKAWLVPAQSGGKPYTVVPDDKAPHCTCPDHETRGCKCKHIYAVEFAMRREENDDGTITETLSVTETVKRTTYPQVWPAYNEAQVNEKGAFLALLRDLCRGIHTPPCDRPGRPAFPVQDALFAACYKVYSGFSGRRFMTDLRDAQAKGYINRAASYNTVFKFFEQPETFELLRALVVEAAAPLKPLEQNFACDSSGFSGSRFDRWYDEKWGERRSKRAWVKAHVMTGVKTNVITAVEIHDKDANDGVQLPPLLATTTKRFDVKQLAGDLAYSSVKNLTAVERHKAYPLIPFKCNATDGKGGIWARMYHYFSLNREEFLGRYHMRSNVESTFSMVKRKFGDSVRSKTDVAMKNEVLAKFVCHNICCLIQSMYEFSIEPRFFCTIAAPTVDLPHVANANYSVILAGD